jgi:4-hydroxythreonine-4-phosphate dehydrogenase
MGDPAGISPELTPKIISLSEVLAVARLMVIGDPKCNRG